MKKENLKDSTLLREAGLVNGDWIDMPGRVVEVVNPANLDVIGSVPDMGAAATSGAISAACEAFSAWRAETHAYRARLLEEWHRLILNNIDDLAAILTWEQGKPLAEARGEILYGASFVKWFAEEARRIDGAIIPSPTRDRRILTVREPVGVCGVITPWNFPVAMITRKVAPALAAGCSVVIKPSELTPFSALALGVLAERAGIPPGVMNIVTGLPTDIGAQLCSDERVRKISFTGSTRVGALLMRDAAPSIKRLSLELGGNAPLIIFEDADLDLALEGVIASKFRNGGQTCVCANRILVQSSVYETFAAKLCARVQAMKVGSGFEEGTTIGPMINVAAITKIERHVEDALAKGATRLAAARDVALGRQYATPLVLGNVKSDMLLSREETFGPIAPLFSFNDEAEAVETANATPFGLAAYFFTQSMNRSWRVADALEFGMVGFNTGSISTEVAPFGGVKQSGIGREGSRMGIDEYLEVKSFHIGGLS